MNSDPIIELAEGLADAHRGNGGGGDPIVGFRDYEVIVAHGDFGDDFEGLLRFRDGEFQAFVNSGSDSDPRTAGRQNFTAAHEFGHYSIQAHRDAIRSGKGCHKDVTGFMSREPMEREADIFAAHFLMPTRELQKRYRAPQWGAKEILDAAGYFGTSITCAALRCQAAMPGDSTLVLWGPKYVQWQRMNRDWWFELPVRSIRNADQLAQGSATEQLMAGADIPECGFITTGTTRSAWFRRVSSWSSNNSILIEQAIPLGSYGVLTLLRPDHF
ncbi:MAG: ImmA/IrrE family metallo-endopeptidase [Gammaproteobacteria bacterium]|nr:ImmA/IrrE family metallo-endopeptidase [Gammaproteobacteria bacterium]